MRVRTFMRPLRRARGLTVEQAAACAGLAKGEISMLERGHALPRDEQLPGLYRVYGHPSGWYPAGVLHVLMDDLAECPGCGDELEPDSSRRRRYHSPSCRSAARRATLGRLNGEGAPC